jgi:hypothetical protein
MGPADVVDPGALYAPTVQAPELGLGLPVMSKQSAPIPGIGWPLQRGVKLAPALIRGEPDVGAQFTPTMPTTQDEDSLRYPVPERL